MDLLTADIDTLLQRLGDRAADPTAWLRLGVLAELTRRVPLPAHAVSAVADALLDPDCWTDDSNTYDCSEAYERRYIDQAAVATLLAHGAGALPDVLRVWSIHPRSLGRRLQDFLEQVDPTTLAVIATDVTTRDQIRRALEHPDHDPHAPTTKILNWTLTQFGHVFCHDLLTHPSAEIRGTAAATLATRNEPGDFERLLEFAATEDDARAACAAVRALASATIPTGVPEAAMRHLPPLFRLTALPARDHLCAFLLKLGPRASVCAAELARLTIATPHPQSDGEDLRGSYAAARVLRSLPALPAEAREILEAATGRDPTLRRRVAMALGH